MHARVGEDGVLHVDDHLADFRGGGAAHVHDEAGVFGGYLGTSHCVPLHACVLDELARIVPDGALKGAAGAAQLERLLVLAALLELRHAREDLVLVERHEVDGRVEHDVAAVRHHAVPVVPLRVGC